MIIDKLESVKAGHWLVHLENGDALRLTDAEVADFSLHTGMELDGETLAELEQTAYENALRRRAANMLSTRPMSRAELIRKLSGRDGETPGASRTADWAETLGLLNDEEYAEALIRQCAAKGYGLYRARQELYRRAVPRQYWDDALDKLPDPAEAVDAFLSAKLPKGADAKEIARCYNALLRRGFSHSDITEGLRRRNPESEWE